MSKKSLRFVLIAGLLCAPRLACAQANTSDVAACDLARDPRAFDKKRISVRGTFSVNFEDFSLGIGNCDTRQAIWLAFGGDVPGIVISTVNDNTRKSGVDLQVNGVSYGIQIDENFRRLYALIAAVHVDEPEYKVTATLTGTFFAGKERKLADGRTNFGGYGHLGCCSLLIITKVSDVESVPPANLDLRGVLLGVDGKPVEGFTVLDDVVGGSPPERQQTVTNEKGEFAFSNSGQQLRFENPNFRPLALTVEPGGAPIQVRLQDSKQSDWVIPACSEPSSSRHIGFSVLFALPKALKSSPENNNADLFIYPRGKEDISADLFISRSADEIRYGSDSIGSERFEERWIKDTSGNVVGMDAWARRNRREHWRRAVFLHHDSASYWLQHGERPNALDKVIDSACIAKH